MLMYQLIALHAPRMIAYELKVQCSMSAKLCHKIGVGDKIAAIGRSSDEARRGVSETLGA